MYRNYGCTFCSSFFKQVPCQRLVTFAVFVVCAELGAEWLDIDEWYRAQSTRSASWESGCTLISILKQRVWRFGDTRVKRMYLFLVAFECEGVWNADRCCGEIGMCNILLYIVYTVAQRRRGND